MGLTLQVREVVKFFGLNTLLRYYDIVGVCFDTTTKRISNDTSGFVLTIVGVSNG